RGAPRHRRTRARPAHHSRQAAVTSVVTTPATDKSHLLESAGYCLREVESSVWVVRALDLDETGEVRPVVRVLPVLEVRVDVILVREAGNIRSHRGVEATDPVQARIDHVTGVSLAPV